MPTSYPTNMPTPKFYLREVPTFNPSLSESPSIDHTGTTCSQGEILFTLNLTTGSCPSVVSWNLYHDDGSFLAGSEIARGGNYEESSVQYITEKCVPIDCYSFLIQRPCLDATIHLQFSLS